MDQDKQKQITGYFIEEAKEHLQTIESGLLNLQTLMGDAEAVNEIFRAAHSIKGGAAMLGFSSIQHVAHNFEDYFKVIRENTNFKVDQDLQTLFLQAFDKLQELVEHLQSPYGLTKDAVDTVMAGSDQIFENLKNHLQTLISGKVSGAQAKGGTQTSTKVDTREMLGVFQSEIPLKLRNMLELFKQPDSPRSRQNLSTICTQLQEIGDRFGLNEWNVMIQSVKAAVVNPNNQFRVLAPILIKEIKQAQEQILAQKAHEIRASSQLLKLVPDSPTEVTKTTTGQLSGQSLGQTSDSGNTSADEVSKIFGAVIEEDKALKSWQTFSEVVGWRQNATWISSNATYSQTAPNGHFPTPLWLAAWHQSKDSKAQELQAQYAALLAKISSCNIN